MIALLLATAVVDAAPPATADAPAAGTVEHVTRDGVRLDLVHVARTRTARHGHGATRSDFDGDGIDDVVAGGQLDEAAGPGEFGDQGSSGAVAVTYSSVPRDDVVVGEFVWGSCACFGSATTAGDFDGDGYDDLVVGDSDEVSHGDARRGHGGGVWVIPGSSRGLVLARAQHVTQDTSGVPGVQEDQDWFGAALAAGDLDDDGYDDLAVGAPNEKVGRAAAAGAVSVLYGSAHGLTGAHAVTITQGTRGVPGAVERGDEFGWSLAIGRVTSDRYADLVVGSPHENYAGSVVVSSADPADTTGTGSVTLLRGSRGGVSFAHVSAVSGRAAARAAAKARTMKPGTYLWQLGWSLATGDIDGDGLGEVVVGDWAAQVQGVVNGGAVVALEGRSGLTATGVRVVTQQTAGVPSAPHDDEYFGTAVAVGDVTGDGRADVVVGAPGQDVGKVAQGGTVTVLRGSRSGLVGTGATVVSRATSGVPGSAGRRAGFGLAVDVLNLDGTGPADIAVGELPPETPVWLPAGPRGSVLLFAGAATAPRYLSTTTGRDFAVPDVVVDVDRYGSVLPGRTLFNAF